MRDGWRDEDFSSRVAGAVGAVFAIALIVIAVAALEGNPRTAVPAGATAVEPPVVQSPSRLESPAPPVQAPRGESPERVLRIYRCRSAAGVTFSDTSCGPGAVVQEIDASRLNTYSQAPIAAEAGTPHDSSDYQGRPRSVPYVAARSEPRPSLADCQRIQDQIDQIDARMRIGYSASTGERLRAQRRVLADRYYADKCSITGRR